MRAINTYTGSMVELGTALGMELFLYAKEIRESVDSLRRSTERLIQETVGKLFLSISNSRTDKEEREKEKRFNDWLSYSVRQVEKEMRKNLDLQVSSPPSWIFDLEEFHDWLNGNSTDGVNVLWLSGLTGFGKSVLAAYVIEELKKFASTPITYFFCKDNEFLRDAHHIMRTFLHQATISASDIRTLIKGIWEMEDEFKNLPEHG